MYAGSKVPYSYDTLKQALKRNDLILFKIRKNVFLENIPYPWTPKRHRFDLIQALVAQVESKMQNHTYYEVSIDNRSGAWYDDEPMWHLTKLYYFYSNQVDEYFCPITIAPNHPMLDVHPGLYRMAMLDYQPDHTLLTFIIDYNRCMHDMKLFNTFCTLTKMHYFSKTSKDKWEKLINLDKLGPVTITHTAPGLNFVTDRPKQSEYKKLWNISYNKNRKLLKINKKPFLIFNENDQDWRFF